MHDAKISWIHKANNGAVVCEVITTTAQAQLIQQSSNSGSAQVQILLTTCRRFAMVRISDDGLGWE